MKYDSNAALAVTGVMRIQGGLSVNGALGITDDRVKGGRVGIRYGW